MELEEIKTKKRRGDVVNILNIVNKKRKESGLEEYSEHTIKSMLNGKRTLKDDVSEAADVYYGVLDR